MPTNPAPLLRIRDLSASIGGQEILQDVNLEMAQSDWLAVVGGSGAGKSTLLRAVMGLFRPARPTAGQIEFNGQARYFADVNKARMAGIAFVPQSPAHGFDPLRRLRWQWDQLARHNQVAAGRDRREILTALGLPDLGSSFPHQWSRGMQQRLLLAMALADAPKLLILDEPTSALDPLIAAQVLQETQRLSKERNIAVMMVTHDLSLAARFANQIAIMQAGRVVESGPADQVLCDPKHPYSRELVSYRGWHRAELDRRHAAE